MQAATPASLTSAAPAMRLHLPAPDAVVRIQRPADASVASLAVQAGSACAAPAGQPGSNGSAHTAPQRSPEHSTETQAAMLSASHSAQPSSVLPPPAAQHMNPAVSPAPVDEITGGQPATPAQRVEQLVTSPPPAVAGAATPEPISLSAPPSSDLNRLAASGLLLSEPTAAQQGPRRDGKPAQLVIHSTPTVMATVQKSPSAGKPPVGQQHVGAESSSAVQLSRPAVPPAKPAVERAASPVAHCAAEAAAPAVSLAAGQINGMQPVAASNFKTMAGEVPAAPKSGRKWQPPPKMQAALVPDGTAETAKKPASAAIKPATADRSASVMPQDVVSKADTSAGCDTSAGRYTVQNAKKRQLPAKLAAMTAAAAAPAVSSADGRAAPSAAAVPAPPSRGASQPPSAAQPGLDAPAPHAQQRPEPAAQQRPPSAATKARLQPPAKPLPAVKTERSAGTLTANALKARSTSLKVRSDSAHGLKRPSNPASRAASAEVATTKWPRSGSPALGQPVAARAAAPARAPSGSAPRAQQASSIAGLLSGQQPEKPPPRTTLVAASPEWGGAPAAMTRTLERKTQVGSNAARPSLLANLQSLVKAAGALLRLCRDPVIMPNATH